MAAVEESRQETDNERRPRHVGQHRRQQATRRATLRREHGAHDPGRNQHRTRGPWTGGAVRAIIGNPRYTGRQVWNKQSKSEVLIDVNDVALGCATRLKWNKPAKWIWSQRPAQEALVDEQTFQHAQALRSAGRKASRRSPRRTSRGYALRGFIRCGICGRKMQGSWNHGKPHYRCRAPGGDAAGNDTGHPRSVYLREDQVLPHLDRWLTRKFSPAAIPATIRKVEQAANGDTGALARLAENVIRTAKDGDPAARAEVYRQLGLTLTYHPRERRVAAEAWPAPPYAGARHATAAPDAPRLLAGEFTLDKHYK